MDKKTQLLANVKIGAQRLLIGIGALSILGVILAMVLPDSNSPSQSSYERCLERAAEKAQGAVSTYNSLRLAMCERMKPTPNQQGASEFLDSR